MKLFDRDNHTIPSFVVKVLLIVSIPVAVLTGIYAAIDPFEVIGTNDDISPRSRDGLNINKEYVSLSALNRRIKEGDVPDSFILGSSISCTFDAVYWSEYIDTQTLPVHFDSAVEGAESLLAKIEYLKKRKDVRVNNLLIVLSPHTISFPVKGDYRLTLDHPDVAGWWTWPLWHCVNLKEFYDYRFIREYVPYKLTGVKVYGYNKIFERQPIVYDRHINEESLPAYDLIIRTSPESFYEQYDFPKVRELHCSDSVRIDAVRERAYRKIAGIISNDNYKVVVTPTIDCDTLSRRDDLLLQEIFGRDNYLNLAVSMSRVAAADTNWYDTVHFRPCVAKEIIDSLYCTSVVSRNCNTQTSD